MPYPATAFSAGLLTILYLFLSVRVIQARHASREALGASGQYPALLRAVRAHGNFQEYAPLFLILLFLLESGGAARGGCYLLGGLFALGRLSHAYSLLNNEPRGLAAKRSFIGTFGFRSLGMLLTLPLLGVMAAMVAVRTI